MITMLLDLGMAARSAVRSAGFASTVIVVLALGVGATTFAFTAINAIVLHPLPYPDADELVHIDLVAAAVPDGFELDMHDLRDLAARQTSFDELFAYYPGTVNVSGGDAPVRYDGIFVSANAFEQLGVRAELGRTFVAAEDAVGAPMAVLIGWEVWQQDFGADPDVVGARIRVNGEPASIVGVMPRGFDWPLSSQVWVPLRQDTVGRPRGELPPVEAFGRLRDGVSLDEAGAELATLYRGIQAEHPDWNVGVTTRLKPYRDEFVGDDTMSVLLAMQIATALVLLVACANVANLILARSITRSRELAVRAALGAGRRRLVARTLSESVTLGLIGGAIGLGIAHAGARAAERFLIESGESLPHWVELGADWRVAVFALVVAAAAGAVAGIVPALRTARRDLTQGLKSSGSGGAAVSIGRFTRGLVAVEIALSCALLVGGALTVRSVVDLRYKPIGADVGSVMTGRVALFDAQYPDEAARRQFWTELEARVAALPGVTAAAVTTSVPTFDAGGYAYLPAGQERPADGVYPQACHVVATPGFFDVFRVPLLSGRLLEAADRADTQRVVVVNRAFAERAWPGEDPVGRVVELIGANSTVPPVAVVGVVEDVYHHPVDAGAPEPTIYQPLAQADARFATISARTDGAVAALANPMREALRGVDPDVPVYWLQPAEVWVDEGRAVANLLGVIFGAFGMASVLLASVGVYGVLAFTVAQRTREFGVRRALGAQQGGIIGLVLRQSVRQMSIALPVGLLLAVGLGRLLEGVIPNVSPLDPISFVAVPVLLAAIVLAASLIPARRAAGVDPMTALRYE